jgi:ribonucleoside-diphosphate reductase beta chain
MLTNKLEETDIKEMFIEALDIEKEFITKSLPCKLIGMNANTMCQYLEFVADRLLVQLGYNKIWNTKNPFEWMELISLRPKSNFFELRVGEYSKSKLSENSTHFDISNDF